MQFWHTEGQLARWLEELSQFDLMIQHCPGQKHGNADGLSCIPQEGYCNCYEVGVHLSSVPCGGCKYCTWMQEQWSWFEDNVDDVVPITIRSVQVADEDVETEEDSNKVTDGDSTSWLPQYTSKQLQEKQQQDPDLAKLIKWLEEESSPTTQDLYLSSSAVKRFWLLKSQLTFWNKVLYYNWEDYPFTHKLLMVPESLRDEVMQGCHDCPTSGHLGQLKTYDHVKRSFMWHEMRTDVQLYVKTCATCSKNKKPCVKPKAELGSYHAGARME